MASYKLLAPFILGAEGGYVNNSSDKGGETNKGITWFAWMSYYGDTNASHHRFRVMLAEDWAVLFKHEYWDKMLGDKINSQRIANIIGDWIFNSGQHNPELDTQKLINTIFHKQLAEDGVFGPATIDILNECDETVLYQSLIERRKQFYKDIIDFAHSKGDKSQDIFLDGWLNRIDNLIKYNKQFI